MILPRLVETKEKKLAGKRLTMSFAHYNVAELWKSFMPIRKEIPHTLNRDVIAITMYKPTHFSDFQPSNKFEKWATVEVSDFGTMPDDVETFVLPSGLYAVFDYKGLSSDNAIFHYIFDTWLPQSDFALDNRPHVEILGEKYRNNDPNSEEEIWIPVKNKHRISTDENS